jgi:methionine aminopeptidase
MVVRSPREKDLKKIPAEIAEAIAKTENLPFARRTLMRHLRSAKKVEQALKLLRKTRMLADYPPLVEKPGVRVAQTEHTIYIHEDRAEVVTLSR